MNPTKEQEQKLWRWCGLELVVANPYLSSGVYRRAGWYLDGIFLGEDIPIDLNNLFRYFPRRITPELWQTILRHWIYEVVGDDKKDAISLFWVCWDQARLE